VNAHVSSYPATPSSLLATWWPVLLGLLVLYLPTYWDLSNGIWNSEEQALGPIVLVVSLYLIWSKREFLTVAGHPRALLGGSLSAMGLLYLYLMEHKNWLRNGILIASILPIAFVANIGRVMILVLVTYHLGDEAGQGFLHDFAGVLLFMIALLILFALDGLLGFFFKSAAQNGKK